MNAAPIAALLPHHRERILRVLVCIHGQMSLIPNALHGLKVGIDLHLNRFVLNSQKLVIFYFQGGFSPLNLLLGILLGSIAFAKLCLHLLRYQIAGPPSNIPLVVTITSASKAFFRSDLLRYLSCPAPHFSNPLGSRMYCWLFIQCWVILVPIPSK